MVSIQPSHEELAALFSRNLTFNPELQAPAPIPQRVDPIAGPSITHNAVYSVSQHYHHSAHIPGPSSEPQQNSTLASEAILRTHGIDTGNLTPSQLQLFRVAEAPQQRRLLELWSICPPSKGGDIPALAWSSATMEQEEHLAQLRHGRQQQEQHTMQTGDGRWTQQPAAESEPYMMSGYAELMRREEEREAATQAARNSRSGPSYTTSTDPVYMGPDFARQQQQLAMASQYGAFEYSRGMGQADAMDVM